MNLTSKVLAVLLAITGVLLGFQTLRAEHYKNNAYDNALVAASERAKADTGVLLHGKQLQELRKVYGDSMSGFRQLLVQEKQREDALDRSLQQTRKLNVTLATQIKSLEAHGAAPVTVVTNNAGLDVRVVNWTHRQVPYTASLHAEVPPPPDSARIDLRVNLDTLQVGLRVGCSLANRAGVRDASVLLAMPDWVTYQITSRSIDRDVCSSPPKSKRHWALGLSAGYGYTLGAPRPGPGALIGATWFPF